jgi:mono/diheme cytochrome c family protein
VWLAGCSNTTAASPDRANDPALGRSALLTSSCSGCHAPGGQAIVSLEGYTAERLKALLTAYRSDGETAMHRMARGYTEAEIESIATTLGHP